MAIGIDFVLKASTASFTAGVATARNSIKDLKKSFRGMELGSIGRMFGMAGVVAGLTNAVAAAREVAEEASKTGKAIDDGTLALVRFGDTMAGLRKAGNDVFGWVAQGMQRIGLQAAGMVYGFEHAVNAALELKKEGEAAVKALTDEKLSAALKELTKFRNETGFKRASDEEKINTLLAKQVELLREQHAAGKDTTEGVKLQLEIEKNRVEIGEVNARIEKEQAKVAAERAQVAAQTTAAAEAERAAREAGLVATQEQYTADVARTEQLRLQASELEDQERRLSKMLALSNMLNAAGGGVFNDASDEALKERLRRSSQRVINQQNNMAGKDGSVGAMIIGADIGRLQVEIQNIKAELAFREKLRRDFELGGEAQARRNFAGDPMEFDRVFQQLVQDTRDNKAIQSDTLKELREINQRQKSGIAVINMGRG